MLLGFNISSLSLSQECSVFIFDKRVAEKLFKPKRKESMLERIRYCVDQLEKMRNPRMLQIIHALEENSHTFAFASESVLGSLHNILTWHVSNFFCSINAAPLVRQKYLVLYKCFTYNIHFTVTNTLIRNKYL